MRIVVQNSPNQSERIHGNGAVRLIICHTPEGSYESAIGTIMGTTRRVSYHRLIRKDGSEATQFVPYSRKAWHAGPLNSLSDGIAIEGYAWHFDLDDRGVAILADEVARRLHLRGLPAQWATDPARGGFCRHGDLQRNRTDPTPDLAEWRLFVGMVEAAYARQARDPDSPWPIPVPSWFWAWARWRLQGRKGDRPDEAPALIPLWAWRRLRALEKNRRR